MSNVQIHVNIDGSDYEVSKRGPSIQRMMTREEPTAPTLALLDEAVRDIKAAITARDQEEL